MLKISTKRSSCIIFFVAVVAIIFVSFSYFTYLKENAIEEQAGALKKAEILKKKIADDNAQYVLLSFDGSRSNAVWRETLDFANEIRMEGKPVSFTYFISSIYFLTEENSEIYNPPHASKGRSLIGYAYGYNDLKKRVDMVNEAVSNGHEIASHAVGHFDGYDWSLEDWVQELKEQNKILDSIKENNPNIGEIKLNFNIKNIKGFRAPSLAVSPSLYPSLKEMNYEYDSSGVGEIGDYPKKDKYGIWHIPLISISYPGIIGKTLSMDYNIWSSQTQAQDIAKKETLLWDEIYKNTLEGYLDYFNKQYNNGHAPVVIGHHFSLWNDGVYFEVMKEFAREVCGKPNVRCSTMSEYVEYLENR